MTEDFLCENWLALPWGADVGILNPESEIGRKPCLCSWLSLGIVTSGFSSIKWGQMIIFIVLKTVPEDTQHSHRNCCIEMYFRRILNICRVLPGLQNSRERAFSRIADLSPISKANGTPCSVLHDPLCHYLDGVLRQEPWASPSFSAKWKSVTSPPRLPWRWMKGAICRHCSIKTLSL